MTKTTGASGTAPRGALAGPPSPESQLKQWTGLALKPAEFARVRELAYRHGGIDLHQGKEQLVAARLAKHMRTGGYASVAELLSVLEADRTGESLMALLDVLTTNHTSFLREPEHFDFLRSQVLPGLAAGQKGAIRIWCAASSTGEEPYSLLFTLLDALSAAGSSAQPEIFATDISTRVLRAAEMGIYPADRLQGLPAGWIQRFFLRGSGQWTGHYRVKPAYASMVRFSRFNLMERVPPGWRFPVIFCRNVMIYFDRPTQTGVVHRLTGSLEPGGYLFVGHAESLTGIEHSLTYLKPAVYRRLTAQGREGR